jgi:hypothetical protein
MNWSTIARKKTSDTVAKESRSVYTTAGNAKAGMSPVKGTERKLYEAAY